MVTGDNSGSVYVKRIVGDGDINGGFAMDTRALAAAFVLVVFPVWIGTCKSLAVVCHSCAGVCIVGLAAVWEIEESAFMGGRFNHVGVGIVALWLYFIARGRR